MRHTSSLHSALTRQLHRCAVALPPSPRGRGFYLAIIVALTTFARAELSYPPKLPDGKAVVTDTSDAFIKRNEAIAKDVDVAKTAPTIDFMYCPKQTYPGNPWSVWGDGLAIKGKYYSAIGDHTGPRGNAFVFEYDPANKTMGTIVDVQNVLNLPEGHYTPGKIHSRIDMGICIFQPTADQRASQRTSSTTRATGFFSTTWPKAKQKSSRRGLCQNTASQPACSIRID